MDHSEHRKRILARFERGEYLEDHELLEILLFFSRPRVNTNGIAHDLIDTFGSLKDVMYTPQNDLKGVDGVGDHSARLIGVVSEIMYRCRLSSCDTAKIYSDEAERQRYFCALLDGARQEKIYMAMFGKTKRFVGCELIGDGIADEAMINTFKAIEKAKKAEAAYVMIAHNHPGGIAAASKTDMNTAELLDRFFKEAGITVLGHYVVAGEKCVAYRKANKK
jgi:DNA repair protein RadC